MSVWDELVGQDETVAALRAAAVAAVEIAAGRPAPAGVLTHAWLLTGPAGSGRTIAARAFAAALQCSHTEDPGCGQCQSCHTVLLGSHPDVKIITTEGVTIAVAETRKTLERASSMPMLGRWQVLIVEDADRLSENASNALLKFVEEPPARTIFILCAPSTHPDDISVTIRSRCRHLVLRIPPTAAVEQVLTREGIDAETAAWAAAAGQGHIGRSRRLARDESARAHRTAVLAIPASLRSLAACFAAADHLIQAANAESAAISEELDASETASLQVALGGGGTGKGTSAVTRGTVGIMKDLEKRQKMRATRAKRDCLDRALVDLAAFYRDVLLVQSRATVAPVHPDFDDDVRAVAVQVSPVGVIQRLDAILDCRLALDRNVKPQIAVEAMTAALRLP